MSFFIITLCVFLIFHLSAYYGLIRHISPNPKTKIYGVLACILNFVIIFGFSMCVFVLRLDMPRFLVIFLSIFVLIALLFFAGAFLNLPFLLIFKNKLKYKFLAAKIVLFITICSVIISFYNATKLPRITKQTIYLQNLVQEARILMISDLHLSKFMSVEKLEQIIDLANAQNADYIVLVGDIIDAKEKEIKEFLPTMQKLRAKNGIYFVLGNHEFIFGAQKSLDLMQGVPNLRALVNENIEINSNFNLAGISDLSAHRARYRENSPDFLPDIQRTLKGINPNLPTILLAHQPNTIKLLGDEKVDLMLSGHTHGGQIFPFSIGAYFGNPFLYGLKTIDKTQVFISQGANLAVTYGRFFSRAEMNLITLKGV